MAPPSRASALALYRDLLRAVRTFPSKKRAAIRADIVLTMRESAALTSATLTCHCTPASSPASVFCMPDVAEEDGVGVAVTGVCEGVAERGVLLAE